MAPQIQSNNDGDKRIESKFQEFTDLFDRKFSIIGMITVFERLGKPEFRRCADIPDHEIGVELEKLMKLMYRHQLAADTICGVDDREFYRFITEDLFPQEIEDIKVEGMMTNFIYESYHPNHLHDIEDVCSYFTQSFLNRDPGFFSSYLSPEAQENDWFYNFSESFDKMDLIEFSILSIDITDKWAKVSYSIHFTAENLKPKLLKDYIGKGEIELIYHGKAWYIHRFRLPNERGV